MCHRARCLANDEHFRIVVNDIARARIDEPLHTEALRHRNCLRLSIGAENEIPQGTRHAMVCPRIREMVMKVMLSSPSPVCAIARMRVNAAMVHFIRDVREYKGAGKHETRDEVRHDDR